MLRLMRVVLAEDSGLLRESLTRVLRSGGLDIVAAVADADALERKTRELEPDVLLTDVRMPPGRGADGLDAALRLRAEHPGLGVLVLSSHADPAYVAAIADAGGRGIGYLLKDRVSDVRALLESVERVGTGGTAFDPEIVALMLNRPRAHDAIESLTTREREILALVAEGRSNEAIAQRLFVTGKTVETHISHILLKLDLPPTPDQHRRVTAVLRYLGRL